MTSAVALLLGMSANAQIKVTSDEVEVLNPLRIGVHSIQREGSQYLKIVDDYGYGVKWNIPVGTLCLRRIIFM